MLRLMHVGIRKMAHVTEFGLFSITVFHGIRRGRFGWRFSWALATLVIAVTYAGLDEWHQSFVPLREARARDVIIDAFGAVLAQTLVWFYSRWRSNFVGPLEFSPDAEEQWKMERSRSRDDCLCFVGESALVAAGVHRRRDVVIDRTPQHGRIRKS
jgi:hypothetical protein